MDVAFTPLDFMQRARRLYGAREAVVDGSARFTYEQFFARCDRASGALARLGVRKGDRVASLAPNTHPHLELFYAVPQLGAVLVPLNYRLVADDFVYLANHSGSKVLCVHADPDRMGEEPGPAPPSHHHEEEEHQDVEGNSDQLLEGYRVRARFPCHAATSRCRADGRATARR